MARSVHVTLVCIPFLSLCRSPILCHSWSSRQNFRIRVRVMSTPLIAAPCFFFLPPFNDVSWLHAIVLHNTPVSYPQLLGKSAGVKPPSFFQTLFSVIGVFMTAKMKAKFALCPGPTAENPSAVCVRSPPPRTRTPTPLPVTFLAAQSHRKIHRRLIRLHSRYTVLLLCVCDRA